MSRPALASGVAWVPPAVTPIDPDTDHGRQVARDLGELFADVDARLAREHPYTETRTG